MPPHAIQTLLTKSLTNAVQEELERKIIAGHVMPGEALRDVAIASEMGISKGPVREAMRILEERGLVTFAKNNGVFVRRLNAAQAAQIYEVRVPLECLVGRLSARNMALGAQAQMQDLLGQMQTAVAHGDTVSYANMNLEFHDSLALHTGNGVLYETYRKLVTQLKLFRSHTFQYRPEFIGISLSEHTSIFDAVVARDETRASVLLQAHAQDSLRRLQMTLDKEADSD